MAHNPEKHRGADRDLTRARDVLEALNAKKIVDDPDDVDDDDRPSSTAGDADAPVPPG